MCSLVSYRRYTNGHRKEFTFPECADLPICPLMYFLPLAFADDAFESEITTPEQIYGLKIPSRKNRLEIR